MNPETRPWHEWPITELVPHQGPMCLLERVLSCAGDELAAQARISPDQLFLDSQGPGEGLGAWVGIELMAQAVAAWAGVQGRLRGEPPRIGLLLGSRRYRSQQARLAAGSVLRIEVRREFQADNGLGQFDCRILQADGAVLATAQLTVFGPPDPHEFLKEERHD